MLTALWLNPIGGQGGNSAIEDAACLANQLCRLARSKGSDNTWTESSIAAAFAKVQETRYGRVQCLIRKSHYMQRVQAMDSLVMKVIAKYAMPLIDGGRIVDSLCNDARGAAVLDSDHRGVLVPGDLYPGGRCERRRSCRSVCVVVFVLLLAMTIYSFKMDSLLRTA